LNHNIFLQLIQYNFQIQRQQLDVFVARLRRNHPLVHFPEGYTELIQHAIDCELQRIHQLHTLVEVRQWIEQIHKQDTYSVLEITPPFLYHALLFGKGTHRMRILEYCLLHDEEVFGVPWDIHQATVEMAQRGFFIVTQMVLYQVFSDGNHRTGLYLFEFILHTHGCVPGRWAPCDLFPILSYLEYNRIFRNVYYDPRGIHETLKWNYRLFHSVVSKLPYLEPFQQNYISVFTSEK